MSKEISMKKSFRMSIIHPHAAGVDIGAEFHVVAVLPDADATPVRTFQSFTGDLHRMSDWLKTCHITTIAMESTGVYWLPAFEILEAAGFNVILVNARDAKNVPGRKTDVNDAQWLQKLHSFGLLQASFRPEHDISVLRSYLRQRERLTEYRAAHIQHMQKALMQVNVQLHHAVSDITGVTGLSIVRAIVSGERDPSVLIQYRDVRCKTMPEVLQQALTGNWQPEHLFALEQSSRIGKAKAVTATARKLAILFYNALKYGQKYVDPGADYYEERYRNRVLDGLKRRAKSLGYSLQQDPELCV